MHASMVAGCTGDPHSKVPWWLATRWEISSVSPLVQHGEARMLRGQRIHVDLGIERRTDLAGDAQALELARDLAAQSQCEGKDTL